jgi:hypothetical protein
MRTAYTELNANEQQLTATIDDSVVSFQSQFVAQVEAKAAQASLYSSKGEAAVVLYAALQTSASPPGQTW